MKQYVIRRGVLNAETNNFTGFTLKGEKVFFNAKTMEASGLDLASLFEDDAEGDSRLKAGTHLYAIAESKSFAKRLADGSLPADDAVDIEMFDRLTGVAIHTDKAVIIEIFNEEATLELDTKAALRDSAKKVGLSAVNIDALLAQV